MKESVTSTINGKYAHKLFRPNEGESAHGIFRTSIPINDARKEKVLQLQAKLLAKGERFILGFGIDRTYSKAELDHSPILLVEFKNLLDSDGEDSGTTYDYSTACPFCGYGAVQKSNLFLDLRKAPKKKGITETLSNEIIVTDEFAKLLESNSLTGFSLGPVYNLPRFEDDPVRLKDWPSGKALLEKASALGITESSPDFILFLNAAEQKELFDRAVSEQAIVAAQKMDTGSKSGGWKQLFVTSHPVRLAPQTKFQDSFYQTTHEKVCPLGHTAGYARVTEAFPQHSDWDGSDFFQSKELQWMGGKTNRFLLVTQRVRALAVARKFKDIDFEVAHWT